MRKIFVFFAGCLFLFAVCSTLHAAHATTREAKTMAEKAAVYMRTQGPEKAVLEFQRSQGPFRKKELYIFVLTLDGDMIVNGASPKMAGINAIDLKDPDGKPFAKEIAGGAKTKGSGWVEYKWTNPTTKKVVAKSTYYVKAGNFVVCCGAYKK